MSKVKQLREAKGLTQMELAQKLGVGRTTVQTWESGQRGLQMLVRLSNLCKLLDCSIHDLIEYVDVDDLPLEEE